MICFCSVRDILRDNRRREIKSNVFVSLLVLEIVPSLEICLYNHDVQQVVLAENEWRIVFLSNSNPTIAEER